MSSRFGLYMHIPFCRSKCVYCDFPSYPHMEKWHGTVIEKMRKDLTEAGIRLNHIRPTTVFVGGGTPSILEPELFEKLMTTARECFPWEDDAEVTVEMNPGTVTDAFLDVSARIGVNRVSLGAQSADDRLLKSLGRIHTAEDTRTAVQMLKQHGLRNFNLDMMIGLPSQTVDDVAQTLKEFLALEPAHLSCYSLILEEGTPMYDRATRGIIDLLDEDTERRMYHESRDFLEAHGFHQYEISNFAKDGHICRHNLDCWRREEYLGIGVAAASFLGSRRIKNPETVSAYLSDQEPEITVLSKEDEEFESVMLGLRLTEGLSKNDFYARHNVRLTEKYGDIIKKLTEQGLLEWNGEYLRCTERGMDIQNDVLTEFMA